MNWKRQPEQESRQKQRPKMTGEIMELNKKQILSADDIKIERVETPEWGGHVFVRMLNANESIEYNKSQIDENGNVKEDNNMIVEYCAFVMCNNKGERIFASEDANELARKNTKTLLRIYEAAKRLNGEDIGELEKNLKQTQSEDFASD